MLKLENFVLEPAEIGLIYRFLQSQCQPISTRELGELVIRRRLEGHEKVRERRIYSPEQNYSVGEKIFFYFHDKQLRLAEVLRIEPCSYSEYGPYQRIIVSLEGSDKEKIYP